MEMIRTVVDQGKQAIVLIPEIALTYQTVMRFYRCFGDRVSIMNSRLSAGERYDQMMRAKEGRGRCDDRTTLCTFYSISGFGADRY